MKIKMINFLLGILVGFLIVFFVAGAGFMTYNYLTFGEGLGRIKGVARRLIEIKKEKDQERRGNASRETQKRPSM
jgi:hypothetical protein